MAGRAQDWFKVKAKAGLSKGGSGGGDLGITVCMLSRGVDQSTCHVLA